MIGRIGDLGGNLARVAPLLRFKGAIISVVRVVVEIAGVVIVILSRVNVKS